ncbi:MAG: TRAP transporter substrate-binding protein [Giesbergeria sp.]|nr:TRAP transporter substrate-binding protein [Giesbergeria sp.]
MVQHKRHNGGRGMSIQQQIFSVRRAPWAALALAWGLQSVGLAAEPPQYQFRVVGGLAGVSQYTQWEEPFWSRELPRMSGGRFKADIVPFDRAGVPRDDMLRLLQLGVVPFGTVLMGSMTANYPQYTAPDLAGLNPDSASLKLSVAAFRPFLEKSLHEQHGVQLLALYVYPAQVVFCKKPFAALADLSGRRVRVSSAAQADFVGALGATPVHTAFAQIVSSVQAGSIDCAITGTLSGNGLGLQAVTSHMHAMPLNWGVALFAANLSAWEALPADLRTLLRKELPLLEAAIWEESERDTAQGIACNTGQSACTKGVKGNMVLVPMSAQDERKRQDIFVSTVLPRWLQRCGQRCADIWNKTIGLARGLPAPDKP